MSLQWHLAAEVPEDTRRIGEQVLREGNVYREIGDRFGELFPGDEVFAQLYDPGGRGAEPPQLMALVTVFQMLEKVPDRLAAEWVVSRIDWKYALHLPLGYAGFHFTDLLAFRNRLMAQQQERLLFDRFFSRLQHLGLIKLRGKTRTDATHVLGLVEKLGRMELVTESVRVAVNAVKKEDLNWTEEHLPATFLESYADRQSEYGLSDARVQAKLIRTGEDGLWLLRIIEQSAPAAVQHLAEVAVLRQVLAQQFPEGPAAPPSKRPAGRDVIESPNEPEVRYGKKRDKKWDGYKAQVSETCDVAYPHLIIDLEPSQAPSHDSNELDAIQQRILARGVHPAEQNVDQGYTSAENIYTSRQKNIELLGKPLADTHAHAAFRQDQFQINELTHTPTCPNQHTCGSWTETAQADWPASRVVIHFPGPTCCACQFFGQCTVNPKGRTLELHPFRTILVEWRQQAQQEAYRQRLRLRAGIEATISELVRKYGLRHCRYRGKSKLRLQTCFTAIAVNLARLARWWFQQTHPLPLPVPAR